MKNLVPWIITLIALCSAVEAVNLYIGEQKHSRRILSAFDASRETVEYYQTKSGQEVAKTKVMQLQYNEMKAVFPEIINRLDELEIKAGRVEVYSSHTIESKTEFKAPAKDTSINNIPAKRFNYSDPWYKVNGILLNDTAFLRLHSFDTLDQVIYKGKRNKPYLWIFSKRQLEQIITSSNPNNHITFSRTIKISK